MVNDLSHTLAFLPKTRAQKYTYECVHYRLITPSIQLQYIVVK